ncbi:MAG: energy-coupling factor transporter ATPase [Clostridia bacterium]|nr:energy-coupling factor transporter ATPase [Clostridia bacterium]
MKLELKNLSYTYSGGTTFARQAVDDVSAIIREGSITGIIGHTGSGKSTLVQMMNGLLSPSSGEVLLDGVNIFSDKKTLRDARFKVGLVFQYPEYQLFEETVAKDIGYGPKNQKLAPEEIAARTLEAADFVGLNRELLGKSPFDLSGGQKRRVAIAGVMAMRPPILILDEPASGLDPVGREEIFGGLLRYRDQTGATVIIVSHSMEDMARYAEDILVMSDSRLLLSGSRDQIFQNAELLCSIGLDVPEVTHLINELRRRGYDLPDNVYTVEGAETALRSLKKKLKREGAVEC